MTNNDQRIGRTVAALRRNLTQQAVADAMRERGWAKWSQATVWSVEKGERPLRLAEAEDLARVLGVELAMLTANPTLKSQWQEANYEWTAAGIAAARVRAALAEAEEVEERARARYVALSNELEKRDREEVEREVHGG